jgi:hypothetical protein
MTPASPIAPPAPVVATIGWLVPGAGYWMIGQKARGLTIGLTILVLFVMGLWIGGVSVVKAPPSVNPLTIIGTDPWFMGQILNGPLCFAPIALSRWLGAPASHARSQDIGQLYTAIAGMLNLLAIMDSAYRARRGATR